MSARCECVHVYMGACVSECACVSEYACVSECACVSKRKCVHVDMWQREI